MSIGMFAAGVASDKFRIPQHGLWDVAEAWLRQRAIDTRQKWLWIHQLEEGEKSIEYQAWKQRVAWVRSAWIGAGWRELYTGEGPAAAGAIFSQRIAGVNVGAGIGPVGAELHEIRRDDPGVPPW